MRLNLEYWSKSSAGPARIRPSRLPRIAAEPVPGHQQSEEERTRDVDPDRRPQQLMVVQSEAPHPVAREHSEQASDRNEEGGHANPFAAGPPFPGLPRLRGVI